MPRELVTGLLAVLSPGMCRACGFQNGAKAADLLISRRRAAVPGRMACS
jgi:hypothetical protein